MLKSLFFFKSHIYLRTLVCTCMLMSGRGGTWWERQHKEETEMLREEQEQKEKEDFCNLCGTQPVLIPPRPLLVEVFH